MELKDYYTDRQLNIKKNIKCDCGNTHLYLVRNQRTDASYYATIYCDKCKKNIYKILWSEYYHDLG